MYMKKIIILTSVLFLAVIIASILYFTMLNRNTRSEGKALAYIPENAFLIGSLKNEQSFYELFDDYAPVDAILGEQTTHELAYLKTYLLQHAAVRDIVANQPLYFSVHLESDSITWLITMQLREKLNSEGLENLLKTLDEQVQSNEEGAVYKINLKELGRTLYLAHSDDVVQISYNPNLISPPTVSRDKESGSRYKQTIQDFDQKNNHAILNLHLDNSNVFPFVNLLLRTKPGDNLRLFEDIAGLSSLSMNFRSDALMFSGTSAINEDNKGYLSLFINQLPVKEEIKQALPANTAAYVSFGISDYPRFHSDWKAILSQRGELTGINEQLRLINASHKLDFDHDLLTQWNNEFASFELNTRENLGIVKVKDSADFAEVINKLSSPVNNQIRRMDNSNLLYYSFGDPMRLFQRPYFTVIGRYYVCANTVSTLERFRNQYQNKQLLTASLDFISFEKLQSNSSNINFFAHNKNVEASLNQNLNPLFLPIYQDSSSYKYNRFYALSFQLSGNTSNFYSSFAAQYLNKDDEAQVPVWTFSMDNQLSVAPHLLKYSDSTNFILAQDEGNVLYAVNTQGKELWRANLAGKILSQMHQLADHTILLNTNEKLYRFKPNGDPVPGFPVVFNNAASRGLTLYDNGTQDIRIFIPAGRNIFTYDRNGKELDGWKNKRVEGSIQSDLLSVLLKGLNYIIAVTDIGKVYYFNYNGNLVELLDYGTKYRFNNPFSAEIIPGNSEQSRITTTDTAGKLVNLHFDKTITEEHIGQWSPQHFSASANIAGDSIPELIVLDHQQLYVYDTQDNALLFDYSFPTEISHRPVFFRGDNNLSYIGVASGGNLIYIIDEEGMPLTELPIAGLPPFYYGRLMQDNHRYLVLGREDNKLYAYRLGK